jgi:hypothetical protein
MTGEKIIGRAISADGDAAGARRESSRVARREGSRASRWPRRYGPAVAAYLLATWATGAAFMGDTDDYVDSAVARFNGTDYRFWEFGHLFWRPLGWLLTRLWLPATSRFAGGDLRLNVTLTFIIINFAAGLLAVVALRAALARVGAREWAANVCAVAFVFTNGFLNYAQTGCSYVPGLAFLTLGLYFLARDADANSPHGDTADLSRDALGPADAAPGGRGAGEGARRGGRSTRRTALLAGASFAVSVCLWFLYVWAMPAALAAPLFLAGAGRRSRRLVFQTTLVCAIIGAVAYGAVLVHLHIASVAQLRAWVSPQGAPDIKGVSRMLFGFARSFVYMGNDGAALKRFMVHDPFNPVSLAGVVRLSLWKFLLFYLALAGVVFNLARARRGRMILALFVFNAAFVLGFAAVFLGGDLERYFPLYPFLFAALAVSLSSPRASRVLNFVALAFVAVLVVSDARASSNGALAGQQRRSAARVEELRPLLSERSRVYAVNWQDELINFRRSFPFHPLNRGGVLRLDAVVTPGSPWLPRWRESFAAETFKVWGAGGDVWVSKRAWAERPRADWNWVEGDDRRVSWTDIHDFFSRLDAGRAVGGEDGFALIARTPKNEQLLRGFVDQREGGAAGEGRERGDR